ncbi:MAG: restriction endonuclease subunit S [Xanthomonadales bacterium]|nr:restriction endonuclease subunit S [Xanthomonadales bacterium]
MTELHEHSFGALYEMSSGISSTPAQAGHGAPFLSFSTVFNNYFLPDVLPDMMDTSESEQVAYSIRAGDIFLTRTSETVDELGMSSVALKDYPNATYSGFLKRLRPKGSGQTDPRYMAFYLRSPLFRKTMTNNAVMVLRASLNEQIFSYLKLLLPNFDVQTRIGELLHRMDVKIDLNKRINAELEALAKTIYDYWFVQFDFPDAHGRPYKSSGGAMVWNDTLKREIPAGWEARTLGSIISRAGTGLNPRDNFVLGSGNYYYVTIKNVTNGRIVLDEKCDKIDDASMAIIDRRSQLQAGDILFTSIEPVGVTYLLHEKPTNWNINESVFTIRPDPKLVSPEYLLMLLSSSEMKAFTKNSSAGSIHKGIRHAVLKSFPFAYAGRQLVDECSSSRENNSAKDRQPR